MDLKSLYLYECLFFGVPQCMYERDEYEFVYVKYHNEKMLCCFQDHMKLVFFHYHKNYIKLNRDVTPCQINHQNKSV